MLKLCNVSKEYRIGTFGGKKLIAVNNVSFDVKDREIVSLIGESGSGKTTIGKMILHLTSISSGKIKFDDIDISTLKGNNLKDYYRKVQGVFQDPFSSFNPIFKVDRVFDVIRSQFFPNVKREEWNDRLHNSLQDVGLNPSEVLNKYPHQLSGGQLQRILITRALLLNAQFLVADEITSMLDASTRIDVLNLLLDLKSKGLSILFITHDLSLGYYISERSVILYRGTVVEMGETDLVYHNPLHPYTKMLMSSIPRLDQKWAKQEELNVETNQSGFSNGCVYYGRCFASKKSDKCLEQPQLLEAEPGHFVACWYY